MRVIGKRVDLMLYIQTSALSLRTDSLVRKAVLTQIIIIKVK